MLTPEREAEIRGVFAGESDYWPEEFVIESILEQGRDLLAEIDRLRAENEALRAVNASQHRLLVERDDAQAENERLRAVVEAAQFASDYFKAHGDSYREASWLIDIRSALAALDSEVTA
jgi:hypothetical protein